ncbi:hypothetical protein BTR14_07750 [Rhizobium rhizosphaerae]|uniref:HTH luxR-type domain-containing protein n=2 Tax=Xaviernesmea rhizosphaerae TaxID=1672749 RepID=A0ABX3PEZ5_9HYPH|nr:hypothetical protein BTR14_07750 [Xaviernesmea rhizosphaerae]
MKISLVIHMLALVDEFQDARAVIREFERLIEHYDLRYYALYQRSQPDGITTRISLTALTERWPDGWQKTYAERSYRLIDPVFLQIGSRSQGFRWRDATTASVSAALRRRIDRMLGEARARGLADGYAFPIHSARGLAGGLVLGGNSVDLGPVEIALFETLARKLFWRLQAPEEATPAVALTQREEETLHYLADGMTSAEIGQRLSISVHTVDWYVNRLQMKLQARNRHHAVARAFRLGLLT